VRTNALNRSRLQAFALVQLIKRISRDHETFPTEEERREGMRFAALVGLFRSANVRTAARTRHGR
jgi:hypothetical protein